MITAGLIWRICMAIFLFLVGKLLSASPEAQERIAKILAKVWLAKADTPEDIQQAGGCAAKVFYAFSVVFVLWLGVFAYHHLRPVKVVESEQIKAKPYETQSGPQPYGQPGYQKGGGRGPAGQGAGGAIWTGRGQGKGAVSSEDE